MRRFCILLLVAVLSNSLTGQAASAIVNNSRYTIDDPMEVAKFLSAGLDSPGTLDNAVIKAAGLKTVFPDTGTFPAIVPVPRVSPNGATTIPGTVVASGFVGLGELDTFIDTTKVSDRESYTRYYAVNVTDGSVVAEVVSHVVILPNGGVNASVNDLVSGQSRAVALPGGSTRSVDICGAEVGCAAVGSGLGLGFTLLCGVAGPYAVLCVAIGILNGFAVGIACSQVLECPLPEAVNNAPPICDVDSCTFEVFGLNDRGVRLSTILVVAVWQDITDNYVWALSSGRPSTISVTDMSFAWLSRAYVVVNGPEEAKCANSVYYYINYVWSNNDPAGSVGPSTAPKEFQYLSACVK
jgi:hypothetical protein